MTEAFPYLRQPIALGPLTIPNRIMFTTHGPRLSQPRYLRYLEERARGGVGLMGFNLGPLGLMQFPFGPGRAIAAHAADLDAVPFHPLTAEGRAYYDGLSPVLPRLGRCGPCPWGEMHRPALPCRRGPAFRQFPADRRPLRHRRRV